MNQDYNQKIPQEALVIINRLEAAGYEAYVVGGCVRDLLMGREPNDWDITTSAKPEEVKEVFEKTYDTGIEHGTVTVILDTEHYEVTTYRIEGEYKDFRRPDHVSFVEDIALDLSRRDFTMNAIAYHPDRGFVDPYNGMKHIKEQRIKSVRDAKERFEEDALRILRGIRFSAQLDFQIEDNTIKGIEECRHLLEYISKERIRDEFLKICLSDNPAHINKLYDLGLLEYIMPDLIAAYKTTQNNPYHIYDVAHHSIVAMENVPKDTVLRMSALLHDIGKPLTKSTDKKGVDHFYDHPIKSVELSTHILKDLRFDNQTIRSVCMIVKNHDYHLTHKVNRVLIKKLLNEMGEELFDKLMSLQIADAKAQNLAKLAPKLIQVEEVKALKQSIVENNECYSLKNLVLNGGDLIKLGIPKGKRVGETLDELLEYVMKDASKNTKEDLIVYLKNKNLTI
ncbi:MAG: CCA tRNA nucleotidyltransferase [Cellulosilyticaceae bacterium]